MLRLVPFTPSHVDLLAAWFTSEREAVQWGGPGVSHPVDATQLHGMLDQARCQPPQRLCFMAELEGELVGHVQLAFDRRNDNARVGRVAIAPDHRGQGLAAPMVRLIVIEAFSVADVERVELGVFTFNVPAIRAYEQVGFTMEGIRRSAMRVGDERWDIAEMAILRPEWREGAQA